MSVPEQTTFTSSTANGVTTVFPYSFMIADEADIKVEIDGVVQTAGFTVSGVGYVSGGNITFSVAPANGAKVLRYLDPVLTRETDYQQFGDFLAAVVNLDFDRVWLALQSIVSGINRSIKLPVDTVDGQVIADGPTVRAGKLIGFDGDGNAALYAAADVPVVAVSPYVATLLNDVDAAEARATLGLAIGSDVQAYNANLNTLAAVLDSQRLAKTAAYTLVNADKWKTIALGGTAAYALTVGAASGFDANFAVRVVNEDSSRAKKMSINGITDFWLWPKQTLTLYNNNSAWVVDGAPARWVTQNAGATFYVNHASGSDSNDGLAAGSGNALATIQEAVYRIERYIDCAGNGPTIQLANETFTENNVSITKRLHGNHVIYIAGDPSTPGNCIWQIAAGQTALTCRDWSGAIVNGVKIQSLGSGSTGLACSQNGVLDIQNVEFGAFTSGMCVSSDNGGSIGVVSGATVKFLNNAAILWNVTTGSNLIVTGCTINISAITFSQFLFLANGCATWSGVAFTGAGAGAGSTGQKYYASLNGIAILNGLTLPGATAGGTGTGGQVSP